MQDRQGATRELHSALIWVGVAAGALLLWHLRIVVVIAFGAILLAIVLRTIARLIGVWTHLPDGPALTLACVLIFAIVFGTVWLFGVRANAQFGSLITHLQSGEKAVVAYLQQFGLKHASQRLDQGATSLLRSGAPSILAAAAHFAEYVIVLVISALYLAAQPDWYRRGFAKLFGRTARGEVENGLQKIGVALRLWLLGQFIIMAVVAVLSFFAMWAIGLPNPLVLALIAGLTEFIPYLGPFIGAVPALLAAVTLGVEPVIWTAGAYLGIHMLEGYLIAPMLQRHFISIPPALVLIGILASGFLFGTLGVVVATPLTVAAFIAIKVFYIRDALGERTEVPEKSPI